jgi:type IV pilus assembly protein PilM
VIVFKKKQRSATVVGLDLDPSHIAAAEVHVNGSVAVTRGAIAQLRPGVLRDGEASDPSALAAALKELFDENDLPRRVRLGIANQRIVVRSLDLPVIDDPKALAAAVHQTAPDHIPMPMDEAVVDFQSLGIVDTPQGPRSRVVIVAVRREMIEKLVAATREAGLEVEGIDLAAFGMVRALAPAATEQAVLYINVAGLTNVAVANASGCLFTRAAAGGLDSAVNNLSERRGLTTEHARQWMQHVGLLTPVEDLEGDAELLGATRIALEEGVHQLADTVRNSLNFYRTQEGAETVERALVTGPAIAIPGFVEKLGEQLNMPVEPAFVMVEGEQDLDPSRLAVAAGLAIEDRA